MDTKKYNSEFKKFIKNHNQLSDLLTAEDLKRYHELDFPDNVQIVHDALLAKLKEDPEYEVWVPVRYFKYLLLNTVTGVKEFYTKYAFVSNKGNLYHLRKTPQLDVNEDEDEYQQSVVQLTDGPVNFSVNRAVATSFVPLPKDLKAYGYYALEVKHLNDRKGDNDFRNLQWFAGNQNDQTVVDVPNVTPTVREDKAVGHTVQVASDKEVNLLSITSSSGSHPEQYHIRPIMLEVMIPGDYYGVRLIRSTPKELDDLLGPGMSSAAEHAASMNLTVYGCRWSYATNDEIAQYGAFRVPAKLRTLLHEFAAGHCMNIVGTRVADGHMILIEGDPLETEHLGLNYSNILKVCDGEEEVHKGYTFRRVDEEEMLQVRTAIDLQTTMTFPPEAPTVNFIMGKRISDGHLILLCTDQEIELLGWDPKTVNKAARKKGMPVYGYEFERITDDLMALNLRNLIATQITQF